MRSFFLPADKGIRPIVVGKCLITVRLDYRLVFGIGVQTLSWAGIEKVRHRKWLLTALPLFSPALSAPRSTFFSPHADTQQSNMSLMQLLHTKVCVISQRPDNTPIIPCDDRSFFEIQHLHGGLSIVYVLPNVTLVWHTWHDFMSEFTAHCYMFPYTFRNVWV